MPAAMPLKDWNDLFLAAALEPDRWPEALAEMAVRTGASHGQLIGVGGARDIPFNIVTDLEERRLREFVELDGGSPALNFRVAASVQGMARGNYDALLHEVDYDAALPLLQSNRYVQWCDEVDIPYGCQTNLVVDRAGFIGLATLRKRRDGRTNARQRKIFAEASVAARRAVRLQERLEGEQALLLAGAFEAIAATAYILDGAGRLQAMTRSAEQLLSDGHVALRDGYLEAAGTPLSLGQAAATLVAADGMDHVRLRLDNLRSPQPLFLEGFRLPAHAWSLGRTPQSIIVVKPPARDRAGIAALLSILYRMTAAEADVAIRLFEGKSRAEISDARSVTVETIRGQIKTIYAKTGAAGEAALMRLLAAIMA